ncbi:hypothetical protein ABPG75_004382 [Micractinium tetrahymenae]
MASQAGWHSLPSELQEAVLLQLEPAERRRVSTVCRLWCAVAMRHQRSLTADVSEEPGDEAILSLLGGAAKRWPFLQRVSFAVAGRWSSVPLMATLVALMQRLPAVTSLEVTGLHFELPAALALMPCQLTQLRLGCPASLPPWLSRFGSLRVMDVELDEYASITLPPSLSRLSQLDTLRLQGGKQAEHWTLRPSLAGLEVLSRLPALGFLFISAASVEPPADWVQGLTQVKSLALISIKERGAPAEAEEEQGAGPPGALHFGAALDGLTQLQCLEISGCTMSSLPPVLARLPGLRRLGINGGDDDGRAALQLRFPAAEIVSYKEFWKVGT